MSNYIYIVMGAQGEYDSYSEWVDKAFFDQTAAELWALNLNERSERLTKAQEVFYPKLMAWDRENPRSALYERHYEHSQQYHKLTKRKKKNLLTSEETERLKVLEAEEKDFSTRFKAWTDRYVAEQERLISTLDLNDEDRELFKNQRGLAGNSYSVSEVEIE